jgi:hypothetical protein
LSSDCSLFEGCRPSWHWKERRLKVHPFVWIRLLASAAFLVAAGAGDDKEAKPARELSQAALEAKLRSEALAVRTSNFSPLFKVLAKPKARGELHLSDEQFNFVRQLQEVGCLTIESWLLRGLDEKEKPSRAVLAERLSSKGERLRSEIVGHVEAILAQGILTPEQSRALHKATRHRAAPLRAGRDNELEMEQPLQEQTTAELVPLLRQSASIWGRHGTLWEVLLGAPGVRAAFPNGIGHLDQAQQVFARDQMPKVTFPIAQVELAERAEQLCIAIWRTWLTRGLDKLPLPPPDALAQRLGPAAHALSDSIFAHAEAIVLIGILTPEQSDQCLKAIWHVMGLRALLDPGLAARLHLSSAQREEVLFLFQERSRVVHEGMDSTATLWRQRDEIPDAQERLKRARDESSVRQEEVDGLIWEVLTRSQARFLSGATGIVPQALRRTAQRTRKARTS